MSFIFSCQLSVSQAFEGARLSIRLILAALLISIPTGQGMQ